MDEEFKFVAQRAAANYLSMGFLSVAGFSVQA
jgi:hypothetical protein